MIQKTKQIFTQYKTPILYSGGSIVKAFAQLVVVFIIAKYISPNDLGIWASINLIVTYSMFLQAGLINGLNLELPHAYGRGDEVEAKDMAANVQTFTLISAVIVFVIGTSFFLFYPFSDDKFKYGLIGITLFIMLNYYQNYLMTTFRSKNSFIKLSYIQVTDAFVNLATLILVVYFLYFGMIIKAVLVIFIYVLLLHYFRPIKIGFSLNKSTLVKLLKVGLPIFGLYYFESICATADKLWLLKYSGLTDVGLYSFGFYSFTTFSLISTSIASYIYPRMSYNYGKNNDKIALWNYVRKVTLILFVIQIPLAIIGYYLIPFVITPLFPNYILSIPTMKILLFAGVIKGCAIGVNALWSMKSWKYMIIYQVSSAILLVVFPFIGIILLTNKLEGVSYGFLMSCIVAFLVGITLTYKATHEGLLKRTIN